MFLNADKAFLLMGDLFDHTCLSDELRWLYEISVDRLQDALENAVELHEGKQLRFPHQIRYFTHTNVNAAAWHTDPSGCLIGLSSSTPVLVLMACMQLAERFDVKTALPKSDQQGRLIVFEEKLHIQTKLATSITTEQEIEHLLDNFGQTYGITNPLGCFLSEIILKFIAMHECMHVILGHTHFLSTQLGLDSFMEFSVSRESTLEPSLSQTLEFIADRYTARGLLQRLFQKDFDPYYQQQLLDKCTVDEQTYVVRCLMSACCLLFHFFPNNQQSIHQPMGTHPHPYLRARCLSHEVWQELPTLDNHLPLEALSWVAASLSSNFQLPAHWQTATIEDFDTDRQFVYSDWYYEQMLKQSRQWESYIHKNFGPTYL